MNWCWLFGHVRYVDRELATNCRVLGCQKCERQWLMNDSHQAVIPLDDDAKQFVAFMYKVKL